MMSSLDSLPEMHFDAIFTCVWPVLRGCALKLFLVTISIESG